MENVFHVGSCPLVGTKVLRHNAAANWQTFLTMKQETDLQKFCR